MNGMDSAGSCDSVVSVNSGCSDDSLRHLSAEEKACLMFLEETIESLDADDDSGLSNDEPDRLPSPGNLAFKLADLSASMSKSNIGGSQNPGLQQPVKKTLDIKHKQSYLVPTPFVIANVSLLSSAKPATHTNKPEPSKSDHEHNHEPAAPLGPSGVPLTAKPREHSGKTEAPLPRGPLSYDALVHLRRNVSIKKTPLCPSVDHTIDSSKPRSTAVEGQNLWNVKRASKSESVNVPKPAPPAVAPKPKTIPSNITAKIKTQNEGSLADISNSLQNASNPQVVRLEALQKLSLLHDQEPENGAKTSKSPQRSRSPLDPSVSKNRQLQSSASFQQTFKDGEKSKQGVERSGSLDIPLKSGKNPTPAEPSPKQASNPVGYSVMVVPGMGSDRKEALKKLGLLKD